MPLILLNKPFQVMCQFTDDTGRGTLADFVPEKQVYPAGRLDYDSEGLVALTDDGALQARISAPKTQLPKRYWVQVEGNIEAQQLAQLLQGVEIKSGMARAAAATQIDEPAGLWARSPPIRERKSIPDNWLDITLTEGKNRQVRRMTAAVGLPTLRLIRHSIGPWSLGELLPGQSQSIDTETAWDQIKSLAVMPAR